MHVLKGKELKIINSANAELSYAKSYINHEIMAAQRDGWCKFGEITSIYDKKSDCYLLIQIMVK